MMNTVSRLQFVQSTILNSTKHIIEVKQKLNAFEHEEADLIRQLAKESYKKNICVCTVWKKGDILEAVFINQTDADNYVRNKSTPCSLGTTGSTGFIQNIVGKKHGKRLLRKMFHIYAANITILPFQTINVTPSVMN